MLVITGAAIIVLGGGLAYFALTQKPAYTITVTKLGNGQVQIGSFGSYTTSVQVPAESKITLTASPDPGFIFDAWTGDLLNINNPVTITVNGNMKITAVFIAKP